MPTFAYDGVQVTVKFLTMMRTAHAAQDRRSYEVAVGAPEGPFFTTWEGRPMGATPEDVERETETIAENVVETLYMALVPDDFWTDAEAPQCGLRLDFIRTARAFGDERLRRAYEEVMWRRDRRDRLDRAAGAGPKEWRPPLHD